MNESLPVTSRYHGVGTAALDTADGTRIVYLRRRFVPPPERLQTLQLHEVVAGDRLDNLAGRYLGDPEQFWRLCDANRAMWPDDLLHPVGRKLQITLPEGVRGAVL